MGRQPRRRSWFRAVTFCLVLFGLALSGLWMARDLPRQWLENQIAEASEGKTRLGALEILAFDRFVLVDLEVQRPGIFPTLERLEIPRLEIFASLGELRRGVIQEIHMDDLQAHLDDFQPKEQGAAIAVEAPFEVSRYVVRGARVTTHATGGADLSADLRRVDGAWRGRADLRAEKVDLRPFFTGLGHGELGGEAAGLEARLRLEKPAREDAINLSVGSLSLHHDPSELAATFTEPTFRGRIEPDLEGTWAADLMRLESTGADRVRAHFPELRGEIRASGEDLAVSSRSTSFESLEFTAADVATGTFQASLHALDLEKAQVRAFDLESARGQSDIALSVSPHGVRITAAARVDQSAWHDGTLAHPGGELQVEVSTPSQGAWPLALELRLPVLAGAPLPPLTQDLLPIRARASGVLKGAGPAALGAAETDLMDLGFSGRVDVSSALGDGAVDGWIPVSLLAQGDAGEREEALAREIDAQWQFTGNLAPLLEVAQVAGLEAESTLRASGRLRGDLERPRIDARAELGPFEATLGPDFPLDAIPLGPDSPFGSKLALAGDLGGDLQIQRLGDGWRVKIERADVGVSTRLGPLDLAFEGRLNGRLAIGSGSGSELDYQLSLPRASAALGPEGELGALELTGSLSPRELALDLDSESLDLARWQKHLGLGLGDVELQGQAQTRVEIRGAEENQSFQIGGRLELREVGASAAFGARVLEGLGGAFPFSAERSKDGGVTAKIDGQASGFLVLWDAYFGDLTELGTDLQAELTVPAPGKAWFLGLRLTPLTTKEATRLSVKVSTDGKDSEALSTRVELVCDDLEDLRREILGPFQTETPALVTLTGGAHLQATFETPLGDFPDPEVRLHGRVRAWDTEARLWDAAVEGLDIDLPFDLRRRSGKISGPPLEGSLRIESSRAQGLSLPPLQSALRIEGDDLALDQSLEIELLDGRIRLERLKALDLLDAPAAELGILLDGISIERLTQSLDLPVLDGQLEGSLPRVRVTGEQLQIDGGGTIRVFGGEIRLRDITGRDIFTRFPRFRVSADIEDIQLGPLTRRLDFGEMQGVIRGTVDEAVLVGGAPVSFDASFESVRRDGFKQTVDVKAVQNLTILGTGASPTLFDRGLQRFLKSYRYKRLGVSVQLENDMLELRGLVQEDEKELFLQGSLLFGIHVVNAVPGQRVSYSAMLRRLENLDLGAVRTD